jgi:Tol biopolymer transport system component
VYVVPATGGEPKRLTFDKCYLRGKPVWSADGRDIIFASPRGGLDSLWRIKATGGTPERLEGVGTSVLEPAVAGRGERLAYVNISAQINLWFLPLGDARHALKPPHLLFATKGQAGLSYVSPSDGKIAFESTQSGYHEIWAVDREGLHPTQLTYLNGISGSPRWSFDGRFMAFDYHPKERSEIYLGDPSGGVPHIFPTISGADNTEPSFSRDGKWLYFSSNPGSAITQVWKAPFPSGGSPVQLTKNGGVKPAESGDGFVYFARTFYGDEIWKVPANGGDETLVMKGTGLEDSWNWSLSPLGIYFMNGHGKRTLFFYEFATQKTFPIFTMAKIAFHPAVTPDGKSIVFSQVDQGDQSIMLVNHFR